MAEVFVEWDDNYSVGIPKIDDQHKELLNITNQLYNACRQGDAVANEHFRTVIHKAVEYVKYHFGFEERLLESIKYPELIEHKKEHETFVHKVLEEVGAFEGGKRFVPNEFVRYLRDWILGHIAYSDQNYHRYIVERKKQGILFSI